MQRMRGKMKRSRWSVEEFSRYRLTLFLVDVAESFTAELDQVLLFFRGNNDGVVGRVAGVDGELGARSFEGRGHVSPQHLDSEAVIDFSDVADRDALPKDGFALAFDRAFHRHIVQQLNRVIVCRFALGVKLRIPMPVSERDLMSH